MTNPLEFSESSVQAFARAHGLPDDAWEDAKEDFQIYIRQWAQENGEPESLGIFNDWWRGYASATRALRARAHHTQ